MSVDLPRAKIILFIPLKLPLQLRVSVSKTFLKQSFSLMSFLSFFFFSLMSFLIPVFICEVTEAQSNYVICPWSHSWYIKTYLIRFLREWNEMISTKCSWYILGLPQMWVFWRHRGRGRPQRSKLRLTVINSFIKYYWILCSDLRWSLFQKFTVSSMLKKYNIEIKGFPLSLDSLVFNENFLSSQHKFSEKRTIKINSWGMKTDGMNKR